MNGKRDTGIESVSVQTGKWNGELDEGVSDMTRLLKHTAMRLSNRIGMIFLSVILALLYVVSMPADAFAGPKLYWTEKSSNTIRRADLDGSNIETILTSADGVSNPRGIAIDHVEGWIYWTQKTNIKRARLDGAEVETVLSSGLYSSYGIDVDEMGRKIYFTDSESSSGDRIGRCNLDGSNFEILVTGQRNPIGIDVDSQAGKMYWAISDGFDGVRRANLDGSGAVENIVSNQNWPLDVTVDRASGKIYFTDQNLNTVKSANLDGSDLTTLVSGLDRPYPIDVFGESVYWADIGLNTIQRVSIDGTGFETIFSGLSYPNGLAIYIPEPAMLSLLAVGAVALIRRRRK